MKIPLLGQTGESRDNSLMYQKTQNWYPHFEKEGKSQVALYPTPGLSLFAVTSTGPIRGIKSYGDYVYVVSNDRLVEIDSAGTVTTRGTLTTSSGRVSMEHNGPDNGKQLLILDGTNAYIWDSLNSTFYRVDQLTSGTSTNGTANKLDVTGETFITKGVKVGQRVFNTTDGTSALVTALDSETVLSIDADIFSTAADDYSVGDPDFPATATHVEFMDGYFIMNDPTVTGRWYMSDSYDGRSVGALEFATAERSPDKLLALIVSNRVIWLLGAETAEAWWNTGQGTATVEFPFEALQSGFSEWGIAAPYSVAEMSGSIFYLSSTDDGVGQIVMTSGLQPTVISSTAITTQISKMTTISDAYGYTYQWDGHNFYVLTFPTEGVTLVYDLITKLWHEWSSEATGYHRSTDHVYAFGKHLVGDPSSGKVFYLDADTYTDYGDTITRIRRSKPIHSDDKAVRHRGVWVDIKEGVGDNTILDPQIVLRWRDDHGGWSNEKWRSMGKKGETNVRCIWRMLGRSRDRVYEIKVTDPVNAILIDSFAKVDLDSEELR